ncbi:uncharacterized protein LOC124160944 isoform X2 [Ischnura elegans]|nr:uncharacterized protein LOC124160944 isoform X2 [Ischnura elegans]
MRSWFFLEYVDEAVTIHRARYAVVPLNWTVEENNQTHCYYPPEKANFCQLIRHYTENCVDPDTKWPKHLVTNILGGPFDSYEAAVEYGMEVISGSPYLGGECQQSQPVKKKTTHKSKRTYPHPPPSSAKAPPSNGPNSQYPYAPPPKRQTLLPAAGNELPTKSEPRVEKPIRKRVNQQPAILDKFSETKNVILNALNKFEELEFEVWEERFNATYAVYFDGTDIFPVKSMAHLEKLDSIMQSYSPFADSAVMLLSKKGGRNAKRFTRNMLQYAISENFASMFSLTGLPGNKSPFQKTVLHALLSSALKTHYQYKFTREINFSTWISEWLGEVDSRVQGASSMGKTEVVTED